MLIQGKSMKLLVLSAFEQLLRFSVCAANHVYMYCVCMYRCACWEQTPRFTPCWTGGHGAAAASPLWKYQIQQLLTVKTHGTNVQFKRHYLPSKKNQKNFS